MALSVWPQTARLASIHRIGWSGLIDAMQLTALALKTNNQTLLSIANDQGEDAVRRIDVFFAKITGRIVDDGVFAELSSFWVMYNTIATRIFRNAPLAQHVFNENNRHANLNEPHLTWGANNPNVTAVTDAVRTAYGSLHQLVVRLSAQWNTFIRDTYGTQTPVGLDINVAVKQIVYFSLNGLTRLFYQGEMQRRYLDDFIQAQFTADVFVDFFLFPMDRIVFQHAVSSGTPVAVFLDQFVPDVKAAVMTSKPTRPAPVAQPPQQSATTTAPDPGGRRRPKPAPPTEYGSLPAAPAPE